MDPLVKRLAKYAAWQLERFWEGVPDAAECQDKAVELGILVPRGMEDKRVCHASGNCPCEEAGAREVDDCFVLEPEIGALASATE